MKILIILLFGLSVLGCKVAKDKIATSDFKSDQIQLDLADKMDPDRISAGFKSLGLSYQCSIDKKNNVCVFSFDSKKKTIKEVLEFMGNEVGVQSAARTRGCPEN